jgi:uncharacterized protein YkwD
MTRRPAGAVRAVSLALATVLALPLVPAPRAHASQPLWLDTSTRDTVLAAYDAEFSAPVPDVGWTGQNQPCDPGSTSREHQVATLRRVNFYRALAGVSPVTYDDTLVQSAQAAALAGAANFTLTHELAPAAQCYSSLAATGAASSNLALGVTGPAAVDAYMDDGVGMLGHRSWLILDSLDAIATGDTTASQSWPASNAINLSASASRPTRDGFAAYPNPGWFPAPLLHQAWSLQRPGADFSQARVALATASGAPIPARIIYAGAVVTPVIGFVPDLPTPAEDTVVRVTVSNVTVAGARTAFTYDVALFVPNRPPTSPGLVKLFAPRCAKTNRFLGDQVFFDPEGDPVTYSVRPTPATPDVLVANPSGFSTTAPIAPNWDVLTFDVTATDIHGKSSTAFVMLVATGSRTCTTTLHPAKLKRRTRTALSTLIPPPPGKRTWSAKGGCGVTGSTFVAPTKPAVCTLTVVAIRGSSRWTVTRQVRIS